ncbi:Bone morphogenetic protein receptor type-2 [Operophtera brumata]|uniref:Bone morphogenetic protein receptor type-2 n=1 Tax=Operophtera brumata TaxID=104452 RepID=A0A0L7LSW1_OPEBR|nr:Bone morphogenetic protein receptor type-2 [Operophtera brumata]
MHSVPAQESSESQNLSIGYPRLLDQGEASLSFQKTTLHYRGCCRGMVEVAGVQVRAHATSAPGSQRGCPALSSVAAPNHSAMLTSVSTLRAYASSAPGSQRGCPALSSAAAPNHSAMLTSVSTLRAHATSAPGEETVTMKAESTMAATPAPSKYSNLVASAILALAALLVMAAILHKMYCTKVELSQDIEKAGNKPCIVHRDVNSSNVLISGDGSCRLADLGLAQTLRPRSTNTAPTRYTEVSTNAASPELQRGPYKIHRGQYKRCVPGAPTRPLQDTQRSVQTLRPRSTNTAPTRYTEVSTNAASPEHQHGPYKIHRGQYKRCVPGAPTRPLQDTQRSVQTLRPRSTNTAPTRYAEVSTNAASPELQHGPYKIHRDWFCEIDFLSQTLVSRNKARPPLPKGPVPEGRALKVASDTCEECWDHDAEARYLELYLSCDRCHIQVTRRAPPCRRAPCRRGGRSRWRATRVRSAGTTTPRRGTLNSISRAIGVTFK